MPFVICLIPNQYLFNFSMNKTVIGLHVNYLFLTVFINFMLYFLRHKYNSYFFYFHLQEAYKKLGEAIVAEDAYIKKHPSKDVCVSQLLKVIGEPQFKVLEQEYHLSEKILLVCTLLFLVCYFQYYCTLLIA